MSETYVGIDIGSRFVHIVIWNGREWKDMITCPLPEGLVRDGRIISYTAMGDFLKDLKKENKLSVKNAALILHDNECICRRIDIPPMSASQLKINLPYEFRDYISGDKEKYYYDYAVMETDEIDSQKRERNKKISNKEIFERRGQKDKPRRMELMAAAVQKELIADYREMLHQAGFKLKIAVPEEMAYINLLRNAACSMGSYCILDLGHTGLRMHVFLGKQYQLGKYLDYGCSALDEIIASEFHVDLHVACSYRESNYEQAQELPACLELYDHAALEIMKAVNYYNYMNPGHLLEKAYCWGGGTKMKAFMNAIRKMLPIPVEDSSQLLPGLLPDAMPRKHIPVGESAADCVFSLLAAGAAIQRR